MKKIIDSPFVREFCNIIDNMYRLGWDERNGGNVSYIIDEEELKQYITVDNVSRVFPLNFDASYLVGKYFLVTGSGKYFKNMNDDPEHNIGLIKINGDGATANLIWGFKDGAIPTSELPTHLMTHTERLKIDPQHRVVIHTHATNLVAMTFIHSLNEKKFSRTLWKMSTECIIVFPEGVGVLPWLICGNEEIGRETAKKIRKSRLVVWAMHGVFGVGNSLDDAFGLIETAEKAAEIYFKIAPFSNRQEITDEQLRSLAKAFNVQARLDYLD